MRDVDNTNNVHCLLEFLKSAIWTLDSMSQAKGNRQRMPLSVTVGARYSRLPRHLRPVRVTKDVSNGMRYLKPSKTLLASVESYTSDTSG